MLVPLRGTAVDPAVVDHHVGGVEGAEEREGGAQVVDVEGGSLRFVGGGGQ